MKELLDKYHGHLPRYASYPAARYWSKEFTTEAWLESLSVELNSIDQIGLYIHIPFCESLCDFCGCNTSITKNHGVERDYLESIRNEWQIYLKNLPALAQKKISYLYVGGGTPNFFSSQHLDQLFSNFSHQLQLSFSVVEVDLKHLYAEQIETFSKHGIQGLSFGVQDLSEAGLQQLNTGQSYDWIKNKVQLIQDQGLKTSMDLMYGFPHQDTATLSECLERVFEINPDRLAVYKWVRAQWMKLARENNEVPSTQFVEHYEWMRSRIKSSGYQELGLGHFVKESDELVLAASEKRLRRFFSSYHDSQASVLLGLGVSSISEIPDSYHQNEKALPVYERKVRQQCVPTARGHTLSEKERKKRELIFKLSTAYELEVPAESKDQFRLFFAELLSEKLLVEKEECFQLSDDGKIFIRSICHWLENNL